MKMVRFKPSPTGKGPIQYNEIQFTHVVLTVNKEKFKLVGAVANLIKNFVGTVR